MTERMEGRLLGKCRIGAELGSGGMGTVYLATTEGELGGLPSGSRVAVKIVHPHLVERPGFLDRFLQEGKVGRRIHHANVVRTIDLAAEDADQETVNFIVMEFVEGRTLRGLLDDLGSVPEALLREIAVQVAAGLAAIHETGIIHRDLKPDNFLITDDDQVRIMDLGVARLVAESVRLTREGHFAGSLYYAAPEQFKVGGVGPPADLYSVGVLLYELATGQNPFRRDDAAGIVNAHLESVPPRLSDRAEVSPFFSEIVATLLRKDPARRFSSAGRLHTVLEDGENSSWWAGREQVLLTAVGHLPRIPVRRETGLHGRAEEIDLLSQAWAEAAESRGSMLLIEGEAGIGKTRLVDAFLKAREGEDAHVLYGSYPPSGGRGGLSDALLNKFGNSNLEEALSPYLTVTPSLVPAFAAMTRHEAPPPGAQPLSAEAVHTVICHLMRMLAEEKPLCWVVDDLHFAKPDSRRMVLSLARALEECRILLLVTTRPGLPENELAHFSRLPWFRRIPLGRLSPREVIEVLLDAFKSEALAEKLGGKIAYKSDGVPFFVFEMIRGLKEGQFLQTLPNGTYVETKAVQEIQVPSAVRDLIEGRLRDLTKAERALLDVGAVQGFEFDADLMARVLERRKVAILQDLAEMERHSGVVRSDGSGCRFDHHQIQEVVYEDVPEGLKREYHAMLADALIEREELEAIGPSEVRGEAVTFAAFHHLRGSRRAAAVPYLLAALEYLGHAYRNEAAIEMADLALADPPILTGDLRADVLLLKIKCLDMFGHRGEERAILDEVFTLADASQDQSRRARYRRVLGWHLSRAGKMQEAEERVREAVTIARVAGDAREEAAATNTLGNLLRGLGRYEEAKECQLQAHGISEQLEDPQGTLTALVGLGSIYWSLGRFEDARREYLLALDLARENGYRRDEAIALGNLGLVFADLGRHEEALEHSESSLIMLREVGDRRNEGNFTGNLGLVKAQLGRVGEALLHHERSLAISKEIGDRRGVGISAVNLGPLYANLGDLGKAREVLAGSVERFIEISAMQPLGYAIQALAEVAEVAGDCEQALSLYTESAKRLEEASDPIGRGGSLASAGALLIGAGRLDEAREVLEDALELSRRHQSLDIVVLAECLKARLPGQGPEDALQALEEHEQHLRYATRMRTHWILYEITSDDHHLSEAQGLLAELRENAPEEYRTSMLTGVPLHRSISSATGGF